MNYNYGSPEYAKIIAVDPEKCRKCKKVYLVCAYGDKFEVRCPPLCANIKKTRRSVETKEKVPRKKPSEYTDDEKKRILEERFGLAARKYMVEHFFEPNKEDFDEMVFKKKRAPKNYRRILFFVGVDARVNPFTFEVDLPSANWEKEERIYKDIADSLDLKKVAEYNINIAAYHLYKYDRANVTPENIDKAIALLFGELEWCKNHYVEIARKLSKRSKQFLVNLKKWRPAWSK